MTIDQTTDAPADLDTRLISAVAGAPPPDTGASPLGATLAFAWRVLLKIRHVPEQLLDATLFPIMFTLMCHVLLLRRRDDRLAGGVPALRPARDPRPGRSSS
ncbi:hypothetical protein GCM10020220_038140 [Nonomuraea rubra]|uniref:hypothetical protein n=1 Tax=Nonomuraea rubra TaxID=46180 RepID=UPI0031EE8997